MNVNDKTVRVYSKPNCNGCVATKRRLTQLGVEFVEEDITTDENMAAAMELGYAQAPVVFMGGEHWAGFRPDKIDAVAKRLGIA